MSGVNKVILLGHVGADPAIRYTHGNDCIASFSLATSESWTDKRTGQKVENTEWHNCVFFGRIAEVVAQYIAKGSQVYLEGKLKTEKYQDKNGIEKYTTKIIGSSLQMLGNPADDGTNAEVAAQDYKAGKEGSSAQPDFDDDVPF